MSEVRSLEAARVERLVAQARKTGGDPGVPGPAPCGCGADGDAVKWNPWNRVVQCHGCGLVYEPVSPVLICGDCEARVPVANTAVHVRDRHPEAWAAITGAAQRPPHA